ncbi:MAG: hypothetical protein IPO98_09360 [Saprospiraceae bacterium]|nr:hypothetical protein [Saprospiraceae bacterium]
MIYKVEADKKSKTYFSSMIPDLCSWHRSDKADSAEINRSLTIARIQSDVNPFIFDPSLAERCFCAPYPDIPTKSYSVNIYPNPSKGLFYIDIPNYKGPIIMKISDQSGKHLETHHLMYSGLMSWRLVDGVWQIYLELNEYSTRTFIMLIQNR